MKDTKERKRTSFPSIGIALCKLAQKRDNNKSLGNWLVKNALENVTKDKVLYEDSDSRVTTHSILQSIRDGKMLGGETEFHEISIQNYLESFDLG
jgi:hypothetical protein